MAMPRATLELQLPKGREHLLEGETLTLLVHALKPLEAPSLRMGNITLEKLPVLASNQTHSLRFRVPDYIGANRLELHESDGCVSNRLEVVIAPEMLDYEHFQALREQHIPALVQAAGADDQSGAAYPGATASIAEEKILLNISQLLNFSERLLKLTRRVQKGAFSYLIEKQRKYMKSTIRGAVRWEKTALVRAQKGVEYATVHVTDIRKRKWHTPSNLLLAKFHIELFTEAVFFRDEMDRRERERRAWAAIYGQEAGAASDEVREQLEKLDAVCLLHKQILLGGKLKELLGVARHIRKEAREINREAEQEIRRLKNRAYRDLPPLWQEFLCDYRSYYEETVLVETQRMADVYALWIVCEMASGLSLRAHSKSLREFRSPRKESILRYDAPGAVREGWGDSIMGMLFPGDEPAAPAVGSGQPEIFLNYRGVNIYFECQYGLHQQPRQQDIYKVLAFMNNYRIPCGGIIYPGSQLRFSCDPRNRQVLAWIPFTWTEQAYDAAPRYFAFIVDRLAAIWQALDDGDATAVALGAEKQAWEYYEAIAMPGAVPPEPAEPLVPLPDEPVEPPAIPSEMVAEKQDAEAEDLSPEEELEESAGEEAEERHAELEGVLAGDASVASGTAGEGDYAVGSRGDGDLEVDAKAGEAEPEPEAESESAAPDDEDSSPKPKSRTISIQDLKKIVEQKETDD
ncbi:MAG: hypothetical protein QF766_01490 [Candidatus Poseidoniia archaeon]|nr:hypothetical protein [Candidatus Poseidoniia archaeon]